jgi:anti-anti-sigma factor
MTDLVFTSDEQAELTVLSVTGEIDMHTAGALREQVEGLGISGGTLVLDLAGVGFVDSSGLGALLGIKKEQDRAGGRLMLSRVSPAVTRLIEITKMDRVFDRT